MKIRAEGRYGLQRIGVKRREFCASVCLWSFGMLVLGLCLSYASYES
jgi:hypothetical protein